jgi:hypothetical protein
MYKLHKNVLTNQVDVVQKTIGNLLISIPFDPANTDAVEFAKWMQEGNRPEPAEEGGTVTDEWVAETIARLLPNSQE